MITFRRRQLIFNCGMLALVAGVFLYSSVRADTLKTQDDLKRQSLTNSPPASQPPLDLRAAVQKAVANNNVIKQTKQRIEQAKYDTSNVRGFIFPTISLNGQAGEYKGAILNGTSAGPFDGNAYNQYNADLKLSQPIFAFGLFSAVRQADYQIKISQVDLEIAERDLTNNVIKAFYQVLLNQRLLEILERLQTVQNEALATAQRRMRTGRGQLIDVLQVKTQLALLKPQIENAHNNLETSGAQLATLLAEEGKYELELRGSLRTIRLSDIQGRLNFKDAHLPELDRITLTREQLAEQKEVVEGKFLPTLTLNGDYGAVSYTKGDLFSSYSREWSVILNLNIPLFSGFQSIYQRRSIVAQDTQLQFQGRDLENTLALNQVSSLKSLQSTTASLTSAEEAADLARQSLNEAQRQFRLATIDFVQFLTVEQAALQADSSLDSIKYTNLAAFGNYFVATGQPLSILVDVLMERNR